jgi:hypothetical protein
MIKIFWKYILIFECKKGQMRSGQCLTELTWYVLLSIYLAQQLFKLSSNFNDRVTIFRRVRKIAKSGY